jgi:hypothetical protein
MSLLGVLPDMVFNPIKILVSEAVTHLGDSGSSALMSFSPSGDYYHEVIVFNQVNPLLAKAIPRNPDPRR